MGTIDTGSCCILEHQFTKGINLPLGISFYTFQTTNLTTIDSRVNPGSAYVLAGLFFFHSVNGGYDA